MAICKRQNGELGNRMMEMRIIRAGMRGMGWECKCGESAWECGNSGWKCQKCEESEWRCRKSKWKLKGPLSGLRQFLVTKSPLKIMKNIFYFMLKALFVLEIFTFLS